MQKNAKWSLIESDLFADPSPLPLPQGERAKIIVTVSKYSSDRPRPGRAFLVGEEEFDAAFARIRSAGVRYYADHDRSGPGEINHYYGGRGIYFDTPDGNLFELITRPYGAVPESRGGLDAAQVR